LIGDEIEDVDKEKFETSRGSRRSDPVNCPYHSWPSAPDRNSGSNRGLTSSTTLQILTRTLSKRRINPWYVGLSISELSILCCGSPCLQGRRGPYKVGPRTTFTTSFIVQLHESRPFPSRPLQDFIQTPLSPRYYESFQPSLLNGVLNPCHAASQCFCMGKHIIYKVGPGTSILSPLLSISSLFQSLPRQHSTLTKMPPYLKEPIYNGPYPSSPLPSSH
jgi:hypothetical protein